MKMWLDLVITLTKKMGEHSQNIKEILKKKKI
jgi:hypothetical protein